MDLVQQLRQDKRFHAQCPRCMKEFPVSSAIIFHLNKPMPPAAVARIAAMQARLADRRAAIRKARKLAQVKAEITTESVNIGKMVEKIAPSFESFGYACGDCRAIFQPIDYLIFSGLSQGARVDAIVFVDVKSGKARLSPDQRSIQDVITHGKLELRRLPRRKEA